MRSKSVILASLMAAAACRAGEAPDFIARLAPTSPFPALRSAADAKGIPVAGMARAGGGDQLLPGDSVTMLVTLHEKKDRGTQWLIYLETAQGADATAAGGGKQEPPKPKEPTVMYTSTSNRFEFAHVPIGIRLRTLGPFSASDAEGRQHPFSDESAQFTVNSVFLGLGLDKATAAISRLAKLRDQDKDAAGSYFSVNSKPFSGAQVAQGRKMAQLLRITPEEERALAGGVPALFSYFETIRQTPDLDTILRKVLSMPSMWSMMKAFVSKRGISAQIAIGKPWERVGKLSLPDWGLGSEAPIYSLPVDVHVCDHRALLLTLVVTAPRPPFLACGGIVGFLAENPEDNENYLTLRVVSARSHTATTGERREAEAER